MVRRMPYEYYDQFPVYPTTPTRYSTQSIPGKTSSTEKEPDPPIPPVTVVTPGAGYSQSWLVRQIGKYIKVEFLIGTNMLMDREGILKEVGINYIVLKESGTKDDLMCDMYSIKFVRVFDNQDKAIICK